MDFAVTFARHFARLIWLIRSQPGLVDDQKGALRAVVTVLKEGAVTLRPDEGRLLANGTPLPDILTGVKDVAGILSGAVTYSLTFEQAAPPADILGVARLIATESPDPLVQRMAQLAPRTVKMASVEEGAIPGRARATATLTTELIAEIEADKARAEAAAAEAVAPVEAAPKGATGDPTLDALLTRLAATVDTNAATALLEELASRIDIRAREGNLPVVVRGISALLDLEASIVDQDMRRNYLVTTRRLFSPQILRVVMPLLQREADIRAILLRLLERAAEDGAAIVFEEIQRAGTLGERAELVKLMRELPSAIPVLVKMLTDPRWFTVRMSAELLGELGTPEAERAIADVLRHSDERVRRTATAAISRFDTPFAVDALYRALTDISAHVRLQAVHGLAARRANPKAASVVVSAIDDEPEIEVQLAEIAALGKFATSDAVAKLTRAAEPDGRLFRRKNPAYRVAAVQALAEARTPAALSTLQTLLNDREKDVRDAVVRMMTQAQRTSEAIRTPARGSVTIS